MTFEVWADAGFDKELARFNKVDRERIEAGMISYAANPVRPPKATRLAGARIIQSFRLRVGPFRLGTLFTSQQTILVTTVFRKKRDEDYDAALSRHSRRPLRSPTTWTTLGSRPARPGLWP